MTGGPDLAHAAAALGWTPVRSERLGGGGNARVHRLEGPLGEQAVVKSYPRQPADHRDRLGAEWQALDFLWRHGVRSIPRPLAVDRAENAVYMEYIAGTRITRPLPAQVDEAVAFLARLQALAGAPDAAELPAASEACFSLGALERNLVGRLERLRPARLRHPELETFLVREFQPALERLLDGCRRQPSACDLELPAAERTLSPSDFGLHNALERDGRLVFLDFEHFGWDDPAKTLADFLLHPGMDLAMDLRQRFAATWLASLPGQPRLARRFRRLFPLYGLKWVLILLNEFLPGGLERRAFADPGQSGPAGRMAVQLAKARAKLMQTLDTHEPLPRLANR